MKVSTVVGGVHSTQHQHAALLILAGRKEGGGRAYCLVETSRLCLLDLAAHLTLPALLTVAGVSTQTHTRSPTRQPSQELHLFVDREGGLSTCSRSVTQLTNSQAEVRMSITGYTAGLWTAHYSVEHLDLSGNWSNFMVKR